MQINPQIVAIIGPESAGKTTLCRQLGNHFGGSIVPEFAREFLTKTKGKYEQSDLLKIAEGQLKLEHQIISNSTGSVFCDTDVLVVKVWHQFKYHEGSAEIDEIFNRQSPRKYLLAYPDLDWQPDPLRENPNDLLEIFRFYEKTLKEIGADYKVIRGTSDKRLNSAVDAINQMKLD